MAESEGRPLLYAGCRECAPPGGDEDEAEAVFYDEPRPSRSRQRPLPQRGGRSWLPWLLVFSTLLFLFFLSLAASCGAASSTVQAPPLPWPPLQHEWSWSEPSSTPLGPTTPSFVF